MLFKIKFCLSIFSICWVKFWGILISSRSSIFMIKEKLLELLFILKWLTDTTNWIIKNWVAMCRGLCRENQEAEKEQNTKISVIFSAGQRIGPGIGTQQA